MVYRFYEKLMILVKEINPSSKISIIMKPNMGTIDRVARIIIALVIVVLFFTNIITGVVGIIALVLAGIFVLTSLISFCPLYLPFGMTTCPRKAT